MFILKIFSFSILKPIIPFQPSIAFHIETSHLFWKTKQLTGFYMKRNTGMKLVDCAMMVNGIFICLIFICLNFPQGDHPYIYCFYDILLLFKSVQGEMGSLKITTFERAYFMDNPKFIPFETSQTIVVIPQKFVFIFRKDYHIECSFGEFNGIYIRDVIPIHCMKLTNH